MKTTLYTMTHKAFERPVNPMYVPLQVGAALHEDLGYICDNTGDHISTLNPYFSELTGMYWVWKNDHNSDIVGICHYRRYLLDEGHQIFSQEELEKSLEGCDIMTSNQLTLHANYYDGFKVDHNIEDLKVLEQVLLEKYPPYYKVFEQAVHDNKTYFGNIIVCRKALYNAYCEWLFDVLFAVRERVDVTGYDGYRKRLFGFLAEFLQMVYIQVNHLRVKECEVAIIGEKFETREVKNALADFFAHKDIEGAKRYYLECREKRPDIIMEASDITGELRLCMQVISTCEFEMRFCGSCILDHISDFKELMGYFRKLNLLMEKESEHQLDMQSIHDSIPENTTVPDLKNLPYITEPMLEIARRVAMAAS